jgi:type IX secretion system PorP/SprF family membrane protein
MKKYALLSLLVIYLFDLKAIAQQQTQYSQYLYSLFAINPAYAGNKQAMQGILSDRRQWVGFDGAPRSQALIFHAPSKNQKMGYGINIYNETIGAHGILGAFGSYSYSIKSLRSSLSFGLRAGFVNYRIHSSRVLYRDGSDPSAVVNIQSNLIPNFDFGLHYYRERLMTGITVTNLSQSQLRFAAENIVMNSLSRHGFAYVGYIFDLAEKWKFQPSIMLKYTQAVPLNFDLNGTFIYNDKVGFGFSYRSNKSLVAMMQAYISKNIRIGYSFDYELYLNRSANIGGSHELYVGFDISKNKFSIMNPRFL